MVMCRRPLALALVACTLTACPPVLPGLSLTAVLPSRDDDGALHFGAVVTNSGEGEFKGDLCIRIERVEDGVFELEGSETVMQDGHVVSDITVCPRATVEAHEDEVIDIDTVWNGKGGGIAVVEIVPPTHGSKGGPPRVVTYD